MKNPIKIVRDIVSSQSKGCLLFIQVGTNALAVKQMWGKPRGHAIIHAEIDTPHQRCRIGVSGIGRRRPNGSRGLTIGFNRMESGYRRRWLKKLGYNV